MVAEVTSSLKWRHFFFLFLLVAASLWSGGRQALPRQQMQPMYAHILMGLNISTTRDYHFPYPHKSRSRCTSIITSPFDIATLELNLTNGLGKVVGPLKGSK